MVAFARLNPDTPGKLAAHAYAHEHMELAAYELLRRVAQRAEDEAVIGLADAVGQRATGPSSRADSPAAPTLTLTPVRSARTSPTAASPRLSGIGSGRRSGRWAWI